MRVIIFENLTDKNPDTYKTIVKGWLKNIFEENSDSEKIIKRTSSLFNIIKYSRRRHVAVFVQLRFKNLKPAKQLSNVYAKFLTGALRAHLIINFTTQFINTSHRSQLIVAGGFNNAEKLLQQSFTNALYKPTFIVPLENIKTLLAEKNNVQPIHIQTVKLSGKDIDLHANNNKEENNLTNNSDFFLADINNQQEFLMILKAFSKFKKWQQSNMCIMLVIKNEALLQHAKTKLASYKFTSSVMLTQQATWQTSSCYACIYLSKTDDVFLPLTIFKRQAAALLPATFKTIFEDAALYHETDESSISKAMIQVYKDEDLHKNLIAKANIFLQQNTADNSKQQLLHIMEHAVNAN